MQCNVTIFEIFGKAIVESKYNMLHGNKTKMSRNNPLLTKQKDNS